MNKFALFLLLVLASLNLSAQNTLPSLTNLDQGWNAIPTDGMCTAGTPYQFYAKTSGESDNLLIYFNGGGACWFGEACDLSVQPNIHSPFADMDANNPGLAHGVFAEDQPDNPFQDYDMVVLPYCTGDVHVGGGEQMYTYTDSEGGTVTINTFHNGYDNSSTVLDWVYEQFASPEKIVIGGSSAGAIGSSYFAGPVAEKYPAVSVVLLADAAGGYISPILAEVFDSWRTVSILPDWPEYEGKNSSNLSFEDFYIASANHNSNLTIAQYNAAEDAVQKNFSYMLGSAPGSFSLPQRIFNHYVEIESAVDEFYSYTAGGDTHTIMVSPIFYEYEVEGVRFVDWVTDLVNGVKVDDISCVNEPNGCALAPGAEQ